MANSPYIRQDYKGILDAPKSRRALPHLSIIAFTVAALTGGVLFTTLTADAGASKNPSEDKALAATPDAGKASGETPQPTVKMMQLALPNQDAAPAATATDSDTTRIALARPATEAAHSDNRPATTDTTEAAIEASQNAQSLPGANAGTWKEATVRSGDNMAKIFQRLGLSAAELHYIVKSDAAAEALKRIYPGQELRFRVAEDNRVLELRFQKDRLNSLQILAKADGGYSSQEIARDPDRTQAHAAGTINDSLFLSAQQAGLSDNITMELASIFGWDIDFALDIRKGDRFSVLYEDLHLDGEKIGHGDILAAEFVNQGRVYRAVRYTTPDGETDYYTPEGKSMRKAFLRTPVAFSRISSRFSTGRKHPILNRIRAHKGVDYAAPYGTPIKATGDGKIALAGTKGGYGKTVIIQHGSSYSTLYAHMSRYGKGIKNGARVKQGQTIGYIGSSGLATGPHLHYEFRLNGVHRNPLTVALPAAEPIGRQYLADFEQKTQDILAQLELVTERETQVALNNR